MIPYQISNVLQCESNDIVPDSTELITPTLRLSNCQRFKTSCDLITLALLTVLDQKFPSNKNVATVAAKFLGPFVECNSRLQENINI